MIPILTLAAVGLGSPPAAALHCPAPLAARGDVKAGPPLVQVFELTHHGTDGTVAITGVEAGCGCLRRQLSTNTLRPGETAKLTIEVNTLTQPDGPNRWQIAVRFTHHPATGAPITGELLLQITATLSRDVIVTPPQVAFSCVGEATQVLTVADRRAKPLTVVKAAGSSPHLTAQIGPATTGPGGRSQPITLRLSADAPAGHRDETLTFLTDDPAYPEFRVPVRVLKRSAGAVAAYPEVVAARLSAASPEFSTLVQLRTPDGKSVAVAGVESDHPGVTVKWSSGSGPVATVRVTVTSAAGPTGGAKVRVRLTEPMGEEVVIPVAWDGGK